MGEGTWLYSEKEEITKRCEVICGARVGVMQRWALRFLDCAQLPPKTFSGFHQKVSLDLCSKKDKFSGCHKKMSNQLIRTKALVQLRIPALDVYFHLSVIAQDQFQKSAHFYKDKWTSLIT